MNPRVVTNSVADPAVTEADGAEVAQAEVADSKTQIR